MDHRIHVVIPAFNEGEVLEQTLSGLLPLGHHLVVVDDGSTDDTWEIARRFPVHVIRHPVNLGQGAALVTGTTWALRNGAEAVVHFDADGQHSPDSIERLLAPVLSGDADVALGSRFLRREDTSRIPVGKRLLLRIARTVNGLLTGVWTSDAHNGLRAMTAEAARALPLRHPRMAHASEILELIRKRALRYVEVPTPIAYTSYSMRKGQSSIQALNIVMDLILRRVFK
jgi:polyprenyl-phospho-N-acetylgalactosaminyl synthase